MAKVNKEDVWRHSPKAEVGFYLSLRCISWVLMDEQKLPKPGEVVRVRDDAPEGVSGRTYVVEIVEKHECDPWESCAFRNADKGKAIYIVVTTTGERLELGWVE